MKYLKETQEYLDNHIYPLLKQTTPAKFIKQHPKLIEHLKTKIDNIHTEQKLFFWLKNQRKHFTHKTVNEIMDKNIEIAKEIKQFKKEAKKAVKKAKVEKVAKTAKIKPFVNKTDKQKLPAIPTVEIPLETQLRYKTKEHNKLVSELNALRAEEDKGGEVNRDKDKELAIQIDKVKKETQEILNKIEQNENEEKLNKDKLKEEYLTTRKKILENNVLYHLAQEIDDLDNIKKEIALYKQQSMQYQYYWKTTEEEEIYRKHKELMQKIVSGEINERDAQIANEYLKTAMELLLKESVIKRNKNEQLFRSLDFNIKIENKRIQTVKAIFDIFKYRQTEEIKEISNNITDEELEKVIEETKAKLEQKQLNNQNIITIDNATVETE